MHTIFLGLGSNQGKRFERLQQSLQLLQERVGTLVAYSECVETKPVAFESNHAFLNAVIQMTTTLTPQELLTTTQDIERELGRTSKSVEQQHTDRPIDIDILTYDAIVVNTPDLTLPHPRMHERLFVLAPLVQIAPEAIHPTLDLAYAELLDMMLDRLPAIQHPEYLHPLTPSNINEEVTADVNELLQTLSSDTPAVSLQELRAIIGSQQSQLYIYRCYGIAVGMFTIVTAPALTGRKAWLEDVAVVPRHQGKGYGRKLIQLARREAHCLGATTLQLTSRPKRKIANRLYQATGFTQRETNVYRLEL